MTVAGAKRRDRLARRNASDDVRSAEERRTGASVQMHKGLASCGSAPDAAPCSVLRPSK
jgi:hypothetical protein